MPRIRQTGESYIDHNGEKQKTRKKTKNQWFETQDSIAYYGEFEKEKVVYPETTTTNSFHWDNNSYFLDKTAFMFRTSYANYILGILNSAFFKKTYKLLYSSVELGSKGYQFNEHALEKYPIPKVSDSERIVFEKIVNLILQGNQTNNNTQGLESQIDLMVYKLYELTYAEAKLVDTELDSVLKSFGLSAQDYEKMSVVELGEIKVI